MYACQELSRKLWHVRKRIAAADAYCDAQLEGRSELATLRASLRKAWRHIDQLVFVAYQIAGSPWPGKIPCPHCGAPPELRTHTQRANPDGGPWVHVPLRTHYDGKQCEGEGE